MSAIYYEYRPDLIRTATPRLLTRGRFEGLDGFISVWGYPQATADEITKSKSLKGLKGRELYTDCIYLDFDDNNAAYELALTTLNNMGLKYDSYNTGNRGQHIHIATSPVRSYYLQARVLDFVTRSFPGADCSIYKPSGIIRLPGSIHRKTLAKKELILSKDGDLLKLPDVIPQVKKKLDGPVDYSAVDNLVYLLGEFPSNGGRNNHCFRIVANLKDAGYALDKAKQIVIRWNFGMNEPLKLDEVMTVVKSVYGVSAYGYY